MAEHAVQSDRALGLGLLFAVASAVGAVVMFVAAADQITAGWGFALAIGAGSLSVMAMHLFWDR